VLSVVENLLKGSIATEADSELSGSEPVRQTVVSFAAVDDNAGNDEEVINININVNNTVATAGLY